MTATPTQTGSAPPRADPVWRRALLPLRGPRDRGSEGIQFAALILPLILIVFGIIQASLYYVTDLQASSAAQVGVQAARGENASADAGISAAQANISRLAIARDVAVTGSRTADNVSITVTSNAPTFIPFLALPPVTATAHGVVEHATR